MSTTRRLVMASRGSKLALRQSDLVADSLRRAHPDLEIEVLTITTRGDIDSRPFEVIPGNGLFVTDVEAAVLAGRADAAVHSAKDLTVEVAPECSLVCVPPRAAVHDVIVGRSGETGTEALASLPRGASVGTSSLRRRTLLAEARSDVEAVDFRGNLDTRLKKVTDGIVDAAILAAAGIERLGMRDGPPLAPLDPEWWVPAPGQGCLVVEALTERDELASLFAPLNDAAASAELACERAFSQRIEGGCTVPVGCLAQVREGRLVATGYLGSPEGGHGFRDRISGPWSHASDLGTELAEAILQAGGQDVVEELQAIATAEPRA